MRKLFFVLALVTSFASSASAAIVDIQDIVGQWCVDNGNINVFTAASLTVKFPNGFKRVLRIEKTRIRDDGAIDIYWTRQSTEAADMTYRGSGNFTSYRLSPNGRVLVQLANDGGDNGPRRELKRC